MVGNYVKTAVSNLFRNRLHTAINIVGLAVGLAACLLILLYVQNETSYDKHWQDAGRIYRINTTFDLPGRESYRLPTTSSLLLPALEQYFAAQIEQTARAWTAEVTYTVDNQPESELLVAVDPSFIQIFQLDVLQGSLEQTLDDTSSIALSETYALRKFGTADVLGKTLTIEYPAGDTDYTVSAVFRLPNANTILDLPALIRLDDTRADRTLNTWNQVPVASYVKLKADFFGTDISHQLNDFSNQVVDIAAMSPGPNTRPSERLRFDIENITELHLDSGFENITVAGNKTTVQAFSVIAALIILVASINLQF